MYFRDGTNLCVTDGTAAGTTTLAVLQNAPYYWGTYLFELSGWVFYKSSDPFGSQMLYIDAKNNSVGEVAWDQPPVRSGQIVGVANGKLFISGNQDYGALEGAGTQLWVVDPPANVPAAACDWQLYH